MRGIEPDGKYLVSQSSAGKLYVYWEEYNGKRMLHVRYWYHDKNNDIWAPGRKGVSIVSTNVKELLSALKAVLMQFPEDLEQPEPEAEPEPEPDGVDIYG